MFFPTVLLIIGIVWLLSNLGILEGQIWDIIWPIILIGFAVSMFFKERKCRTTFRNFGKRIHAEFRDNDDD